MRPAETSALLKRIEELENDVAFLMGRRRVSLETLGAVPTTRTLTAGAGLAGGGALSADRTFAVGAGAGITVNADDVAITSVIAAGGPTGSTSVVPVITYNVRGQLTAVATATITPAAIGAQSADADLSAIADMNPSDQGLAVRTLNPDEIWLTRTLTAGADIAVTNGDGVAGNPTVALASAMSTWVPTVTAGTGTLTTTSVTAARYRQYGKLVFFHLDITFTDAGTGAGAFIFTLPVNAAGHINVVAGRSNTTGLSLIGRISSATQISVLEYDNTTAISTGARVMVTGFYEAA